MHRASNAAHATVEAWGVGADEKESHRILAACAEAGDHFVLNDKAGHA